MQGELRETQRNTGGSERTCDFTVPPYHGSFAAHAEREAFGGGGCGGGGGGRESGGNSSSMPSMVPLRHQATTAASVTTRQRASKAEALMASLHTVCSFC